MKRPAWLNLGRGRNVAPAVYDRCSGDAGIQAAMAAMINGNWSVTDELMDDRPEDVVVISSSLIGHDSDVAIGAFEKWAQESPSARSLAMLGGAQIQAAWEVRGTQYAKDVDNDAWDPYHSGLMTAEQTLTSAIELDAGSSDPLVHGLRTGRGLGVPKDELHNRFLAAHAVTPFRADACAQYLQGICRKWGGSNEQMFTFARWVATEAPADADAHIVLFQAHDEFSWQHDDMSSDEYRAQPEVAHELSESAAKYLAATPDRAETRQLYTLHYMAYAMIPIDKRSASLVQEMYRRIDGRVTPEPWHLWQKSTAARGFEQTRNERLEQANPFI